MKCAHAQGEYRKGGTFCKDPGFLFTPPSQLCDRDESTKQMSDNVTSETDIRPNRKKNICPTNNAF